MVRKAIRAGVPALVSKSMPTVQSLELAEEYGLKLFIRQRNDFTKRQALLREIVGLCLCVYVD